MGFFFGEWKDERARGGDDTACLSDSLSLVPTLQDRCPLPAAVESTIAATKPDEGRAERECLFTSDVAHTSLTRIPKGLHDLSITGNKTTETSGTSF